VLLAPSLAGELGDIRLAIPSTGMLTLIFLQQTYRSELPALDYLTFLDWLYAFGYLISILTFMLFVWGTNTYQSAADQDKPVAVERINRMDTIFQLTAFVGLVLAATLAWRA
jgi:magnesium-transporting ATPase (P-type)